MSLDLVRLAVLTFVVFCAVMAAAWAQMPTLGFGPGGFVSAVPPVGCGSIDLSNGCAQPMLGGL